MSLSVTWLPTDKHVYGAIYREHAEQLSVFGTRTEMEGSEAHDGKYILTEWGFKDADAPLIRSINDNDTWTFWIALVREEREE